jgi:hypothetical protein
LVPEEEKEFVRGRIKAMKTTRSPEALHRAGVAAREACLKRRETVAPPTAAHEAAQPEVQPVANVRIRRL